MTELKLKKLLNGVVMVTGILLVVAGVAFYQIHTENQVSDYLKGRDQNNLRLCLLGAKVFEMDENRYPNSLLEMYPDYIDSKKFFQSPKTLTHPSKAYIYLTPTPDLEKSIPPKTIILVSQIPYPRGQRLVGYSNGATAFISEKDLPDFKSHSPAN